ncbi:MAG: GLPGLI family protein [Winogradskyella sp.]|nr:GLPGLI family protein [Winogradskyella sp.]
MRVIKIISYLGLLLFSVSVCAQEFQGEATYKTKRKVDIKVDSTQVNAEMHQKMMDMLKKQFEKTFILTFNQAESLYKEELTLDKPSVGTGGDFQIMVAGGGEGNILYKNIKENRFTEQRDTFGKLFLVQDSLQQRQWTFEPDTKYIGEYLCYKATFTEEIEVMQMRMSGQKDETEKEPETTKELKTTTVWYTLQIPINNGPEDYHGLPGLIMEVNDGDLSILCSKIVLNPENRITIEEPKKGKVVNQSEYDEILEKKAKEMMDMYAPKRGNRSGETFEIRIGG